MPSPYKTIFFCGGLLNGKTKVIPDSDTPPNSVTHSQIMSSVAESEIDFSGKSASIETTGIIPCLYVHVYHLIYPADVGWLSEWNGFDMVYTLADEIITILD